MATIAFSRIGVISSLLLALAASACSRDREEPGDAEASAGAPSGGPGVAGSPSGTDPDNEAGAGSTGEPSGGTPSTSACPLKRTGTVSPVTSMITVGSRLIYTENSGLAEPPGSISSIDQVGGDRDYLFDSPHPKELMNVGERLVWISAIDDGGVEHDSLIMGPISGGEPVEIVSTDTKIHSAALTDTHVYWTDSKESLWRAELAADSEPEAVLTARQVTGVAADREYNLFVTALDDTPVLYRLDKDTLEPTPLVEGDAAAATVASLTVAGDFVYFKIDSSGAKGLRRASTTTPSDKFEALATELKFSKLASSGNELYFSAYPSEGASTDNGVVGRLDPDGSAVVLKGMLYKPFGVASIGKCLYYNDSLKLGVVSTH